jgi:L-alanine-DL-glutamate epimerase-like enolase superfamily enzyme
MYVGGSVEDPAALFWGAAWSNNAILASGAGHRALSMVDLAVWDLSLRAAGETIYDRLGGAPAPLPPVAIIGYPPSIGPDEVRQQVEDLYAAGWRRFKQPIAADWDTTVARLEAARSVADDLWLGMDANWVFRSADEIRRFSERIEHLNLGWIEDVVPPGNAGLVAEARAVSRVPIAMGDEQGGSYHPEALLAKDAVDVVRLDVTTNGGITRLPSILDAVRGNGTSFSCHMFPHIHAQVFPALGVTDIPIEWGVPGTGVDQLSDTLPQPEVADGLMKPPTPDAGFGVAFDPEWMSAQEIDDPDDVVGALR